MYKDHDYSHWINSKRNKNILKYFQRDKSLRMPFTMYDDTESLLEKHLDQKKGLKKSSISKITQEEVLYKSKKPRN